MNGTFETKYMWDSTMIISELGILISVSKNLFYVNKYVYASINVGGKIYQDNWCIKL